jgi:hypothetical protein
MDKAHTFTPGPWAVEGITRAGGKTSAIISYGVNCYGDGPEGYVCEARGVTLKDARLIAAAPELLAALQELHLRTVIGTEDQRHDALKKAWAAILKATITKATGQGHFNG